MNNENDKSEKLKEAKENLQDLEAQVKEQRNLVLQLERELGYESSNSMEELIKSINRLYSFCSGSENIVNHESFIPTVLPDVITAAVVFGVEEDDYDYQVAKNAYKRLVFTGSIY